MLYNLTGNISLLILCNTVKTGHYLLQATLSYIIFVSQLHIIPDWNFSFQGRSCNNTSGNCIHSHMPVYMLASCILKYKNKCHLFSPKLPTQTILYIQQREAGKLTPCITSSSWHKTISFLNCSSITKNPLFLKIKHMDITSEVLVTMYRK